MNVELLAFAAEHVEAAAARLAERHRRHREAEPLLPALEDARREVAGAWSAPGASGAVAVRGDEVAGYLVGRVTDDASWGRHAWVGYEGHASADPEVMRDLYAVAAGRWVEEGAKLHLALVPALPDLVDPWFRLGFAHMQLHGIRSTGAEAATVNAAVAVRPGAEADLAAARPLLALIWKHQALTPTFTGLAAPHEEQLLADWTETLGEEGCAYFVAEHDGRIVGHALLRPAAPDLASPAGSVHLAVAATLPDARGLGAGRALTEHALVWAREAGHEAIVTDWRMANLLASRFWPRRGFRETFYRLSRPIAIG
jgi:ribosomal protein S18 acetylase RimI-like enzyme